MVGENFSFFMGQRFFDGTANMVAARMTLLLEFFYMSATPREYTQMTRKCFMNYSIYEYSRCVADIFEHE